MPRYCVTVTETMEYDLIVDAPDEGTARDLAEHEVVENWQNLPVTCTALDGYVDRLAEDTEETNVTYEPDTEET